MEVCTCCDSKNNNCGYFNNCFDLVMRGDEFLMIERDCVISTINLIVCGAAIYLPYNFTITG